SSAAAWRPSAVESPCHSCGVNNEPGPNTSRIAWLARPTARRNPRAPSRTQMCSRDRKSTRLNSSHLVISYAVFCLKKKKDSHDVATVSIRPNVRIVAEVRTRINASRIRSVNHAADLLHVRTADSVSRMAYHDAVLD